MSEAIRDPPPRSLGEIGCYLDLIPWQASGLLLLLLLLVLVLVLVLVLLLLFLLICEITVIQYRSSSKDPGKLVQTFSRFPFSEWVCLTLTSVEPLRNFEAWALAQQ